MTDDENEFAALWEDVTGEDEVEGHHDPEAVEDAHMVETVADRALRGRFCWAAGLEWLAYHQGRWTPATEASVMEVVRTDLRDQYGREVKDGAKPDRLRRLLPLLGTSRIRNITMLARGVLEVDAAAFDRRPDLLNVGNGVVDLTTGELLPHDPGLYLTKGTDVPYLPGATSPDWDTALAALPPEARSWLQVRVGQAASGHPPPDDLLCVLQGGGSNGKTTITGTIQRALGDHAVVVPERLLLANPSDHPTELMTLRGARLALIEETPEARHLSVKRLKDTVGTPTMTARLVRRDNVTWTATHTLFLTTNYLPRIDETDHGTWRRLAMIRFPYRFVNADDAAASDDGSTKIGTPGLRERLRDGRHGQHEAVLAWVVEGARQWYQRDRVMPPAPATVRRDTEGWRETADLVFAYLRDRLVLDAKAHVLAQDLYRDFNTWVVQRGHREWSDQTFVARFKEHEKVQDAKLEKRLVVARPGLSRPPGTWADAPPSRYHAWLGVRFRDPLREPPPDLQERDDCTGCTGSSVNAEIATSRGVSDHPVHPVHKPFRRPTDRACRECGHSLGTADPDDLCGYCELAQLHHPRDSQRVAEDFVDPLRTALLEDEADR